MKVKIVCENRNFGGFEQVREISTEEDFRKMREELKNYPRPRDFSTTLYAYGIDCEYFEQFQ